MSGFLHGFRHYADFSGRDARGLYWEFIVGTHAVLVLLALPAYVALLMALPDFLCELLSTFTPEEVEDVFFMLRNEEFSLFISSYFSEFLAGNLCATGCLFAAGVWALIIMLPTVAATVRRLRDAGQSPWWVLPPCFSLVPLLGSVASVLSVVTLVFCCFRSAPPPVPELPGAAGD